MQSMKLCDREREKERDCFLFLRHSGTKTPETPIHSPKLLMSH